MSDNKQRPVRNKRAASPIWVGNHCMDVIRDLQGKTGKTQRALIEEHLELAFKIRRISFAPAVPMIDMRSERRKQSLKGVHP